MAAVLAPDFVDRLVQRLTLTSPVPPADGMRRAAVAVVLAPGSRVLLMKRAERAGDPWSGHISLPGGGFQAGDPDLLTTAIRETHEELGVALDPAGQLLGNMPALSPRTAGPIPIEITPFVFRVAAPPETVCGPEALSAFWLPLDEAVAGAFDGNFRYSAELVFPSWDYAGHVIWGLTRRILDDLVRVGT
jgi:8-oxo-dGTP pyrophosphatase MutT (NUDIX family)